MTRQPFKSRNIVSAGFDPAAGEIEVECRKGKIYRYSGCNEKHWSGLTKSRSAGNFFHRFIRRKKFRKIEPETE